jgi:hypothetical protein
LKEPVCAREQQRGADGEEEGKRNPKTDHGATLPFGLPFRRDGMSRIHVHIGLMR